MGYSIIENARINDEWSSNWLNVEKLICCDLSVIAYKILNKLIPEGGTRNCKDLQIPRLITEHAKPFTTLP